MVGFLFVFNPFTPYGNSQGNATSSISFSLNMFAGFVFCFLRQITGSSDDFFVISDDSELFLGT